MAENIGIVGSICVGERAHSATFGTHAGDNPFIKKAQRAIFPLYPLALCHGKASITAGASRSLLPQPFSVHTRKADQTFGTCAV